MDSRIPLETIVSPWPIARNLSCHLAAGDLINLARASTGLRACLHGFEKPLPIDIGENLGSGSNADSRRTIRTSLNMGFHDTLYWQRLKEEASFVCSSSTHTRGDKCRPCRFCSKPICEACIVRSSFQRGKENTFNNRVRYFCSACWDQGNVSKSRRFPLSSNRRHSEWYSSSDAAEENCTCTLKADGWLCLECKDRQNYQAVANEVKTCHGEGCENPLGAYHERRRICLWCQKSLPSPFGGASRHVWTQQMINAKQRSIQALSADIEEYNRMRLATMRMTRRQLRGDHAVEGDPEADKPQYVRHLDTMNYEHHMGHAAAPTGQEVYDSKRGYWRYNRKFLLRMRKQCCKVQTKADLLFIEEANSSHARTNGQKLAESIIYDDLDEIRARWNKHSSDHHRAKFVFKSAPYKIAPVPHIFRSNLSRKVDSKDDRRAEEWHTLKSHIIDILFTQGLDFLQARVKLWTEYSFWAEKAEFEIVLAIWGQDFDIIEQPMLPSTMSERDVINMSIQGSESTDVGDSETHEDEYDTARLYDEWLKADERLGHLAEILKPRPIDEDDDDITDNDTDDEFDQETMFEILRAENKVRDGKHTSTATAASASDDEVYKTPDLETDHPEASASSSRLNATSPRIPSYLEDMNAQLLGGFPRHSRDNARERDDNVMMTFEPVPETTRHVRADSDDFTEGGVALTKDYGEETDMGDTGGSSTTNAKSS